MSFSSRLTTFSLERPCLAHMEGALKDSSAPHGHVLTLSAPLLYQAPAETTSQTHSHSWSIPKESLECLLKLSPNLSSTDEVTPIQAWDYIRRHPAFHLLEVDKLRSLAERLRQHVECHGYITLPNLISRVVRLIFLLAVSEQSSGETCFRA